MDVINLTSIHYIGIIYLSFAHQTDGIYTQVEQNTIWKCLKKWMPENSEYRDLAKMMDDIMYWYKSFKNTENFDNHLFEIADRLNELEWFNEDKKTESLKDLKSIALADKKFLESERKMMRSIAKTWNLDNKIISRIIK